MNLFNRALATVVTKNNFNFNFDDKPLDTVSLMAKSETKTQEESKTFSANQEKPRDGKDFLSELPSNVFQFVI